MSNGNCEAGCQSFYGEERRHIKQCRYYGNSFSEMFEKLKEENARLREELSKFIIYGSDCCMKDPCNERITLFVKSNFCIRCEALQGETKGGNDG